MKKNISEILSSIVFAAVCILALALIIANRKLHVDLINSRESIQSQSLINRSCFIETVSEIYENQWKYLNWDFKVFSFNSMEETLLDSIIGDDICLFLRTSKGDCSACIDSVYSSIKAAFDILDLKRIIVLTDEDHPRKILSYQRIHNINFPVYKVDIGLLPLTFENHTPYLFILDEDRKVMMPHKVDITIPQLTKNYLMIVRNKFLLTH